MVKICFKCKIEKGVSEFYQHKAMKDGFLNKCKDCCKQESKINLSVNLKNPEFVEKEKNRHREKYHRLNSNWIKPNSEIRKKANDNYQKRFPEKKIARHLSQHIKVEKGYHKHHWSYNLEHCKNIIPLTKEEHYQAHRFIIYDLEKMMYRRIDTMELLDSKEKHSNFIFEKINNFREDEKFSKSNN